MCNGGSKQAERTHQTIVQDLPSHLKPYAQHALRKGKSLSSEKWKGYDGERLQGFDPMEKQAHGGVRDLYRSGPREELGFGYGQTQQASQVASTPGEWNSAQYQKYVNPFQENVAALGRQRMWDEMNRNLPMASQQASQKFSDAGQIGGRQNLVAARSQRAIADEGLRAMMEYQAGQEQYGYEQAMSAHQDYENRRQRGAEVQLQASQEARAIADAQQNQAMQRIAAMQEAGMSRRDMGQAAKDIALSDWEEKRNWDRELLNWYAGIMSGNPYSGLKSQTGTGSTYGRGPNTLSQIGGLGLAGIGALGAFTQ